MIVGQHADQYESPDEKSDYDLSDDYESDPDIDDMEVGRVGNRETLPTHRFNTICFPSYESGGRTS